MANRADNFNRADTSAIGTPSDGGSAWVYATTAGAGWGVGSNKAYNVYDASSNRYYGYLECSAADGDVQVTLSTTSGGSGYVGLAARVTGTDDLWVVRASAASGYELIKFVSGSATVVGTYGTGPSDGDVLKWTLSGDSHTVYVNGVSRITASDSFNNTATKHGLHANGAWPTSARWDDWSFTDAGGGGGGAKPWFLHAEQTEIGGPG